jgi:hypothetical protein
MRHEPFTISNARVFGAYDMIGGPRTLDSPRRFVIDVGKDGFNAYETVDGELQLFAASSATSTFLQVVEQIYASNGKSPVKYKIVEE